MQEKKSSIFTRLKLMLTREKWECVATYTQTMHWTQDGVETGEKAYLTYMLWYSNKQRKRMTHTTSDYRLKPEHFKLYHAEILPWLHSLGKYEPSSASKEDTEQPVAHQPRGTNIVPFDCNKDKDK